MYVADHARLRMVPAAQRESYASAAADALGLTHDEQVLLSQTVGYPKA